MKCSRNFLPNRYPYEVLEASGHVGEFSDYMTTCGACGESSRADTLLESSIQIRLTEQIRFREIIIESNPSCPSCGKIEWSKVTAQNLMFNTKIGAGQSGRDGFLRPKLLKVCSRTFLQYTVTSERLPFGAVQVGKVQKRNITQTGNDSIERI